MKRIVLLVGFTLLYAYTAFAQKDCDYNPYQHQREEYLRISLELYHEYVTDIDCASIEDIVQYCTTEYLIANSLNQKLYLLTAISYKNCPKAFDLLEYIISHDESEYIRCQAIELLGTTGGTQRSSFLLDYATKDISVYERLTIAFALSLFIPADTLLNIVDSICFTSEDSICEKCSIVYYIIGGYHAINYFEYLLDKPMYRMYAALQLAILGEYEKTKPIFLQALKSDNEDEIKASLAGLAAIGTEEDMEIIKQHTRSENPNIAKRASNILNHIEIKRETKMKEGGKQ
jgi:hypothetical protein